MLETLSDTIVAEVSDIKDGKLWHHNGWILPRNQIVAVKKD